jgi:ketosteroid isomerase-like protein
MPNQSFADAMKLHYQGLHELINGDNALYISRASHSSDITIAGAWGGYEHGWDDVVRRYNWATAKFKGKNNRLYFENVSQIETAELAYSVDIERNEVDFTGSGEIVRMDLRVTTIFRKENGEWRMIHRHGDALVNEQPTDAVIATDPAALN